VPAAPRLWGGYAPALFQLAVVAQRSGFHLFQRNVAPVRFERAGDEDFALSFQHLMNRGVLEMPHFQNALCLGVAMALTSVAVPATAAVVISVSEIAGDTTFAFQGTLDTDATTLISPSSSFDVANIFAPNDQIASLPDMLDLNIYGVALGPASPFAAPTALPFDATTRTGDAFAITTNQLSMSQDYVSGSFFSGSLIFQGSTFADLELIDGTYVWTLDGSRDTVTMTIETSPIPLPSSLALAMTGFGAIAVLRPRRPRRKPSH